MRERLTARGLCPAGAPERFVRASVLRTLAQWEIAPSPDLVAELTQDGLLACRTRRHAPHIQNFPRYYAAMLRGLVTQHCKRLQREQQRLRRIVKIFELTFLLEVTPPPIAALHLVFRPPVTDTHRQ